MYRRRRSNAAAREGVLRVFGLGAMSLMEARKSGIVKPLMACNRAYYRASELIAWIESIAAKSTKARRNEHGQVGSQ